MQNRRVYATRLERSEEKGFLLKLRSSAATRSFGSRRRVLLTRCSYCGKREVIHNYLAF